MRRPQAPFGQGRLFVRNWDVVTAYTLAAGAPAPVIATNQRQWVDVTLAMAANTNTDWVALEAQRSASFGLEYMAEGTYYTGPLITSNPGLTYIDNLARLPPAGYVHRVAHFRTSTDTFASNITVQDSTRGAELFFDSLNSRRHWRMPDDAYTRRILSRGCDFIWPMNRTSVVTTEPNAGWNINASRSMAPVSTSPTVQQTAIVPCSYGKSIFWNATSNTLRGSVPTPAEDLSTMTFQVWVKLTAYGAGTTNVIGGASSNAATVMVDSSTGQLRVFLANSQIHTSVGALSLNTSYMVTIVVTSALSGSLYINGAFDSTFTLFGTWLFNTAGFVYVGATPSTGAANMYAQYASLAKSAWTAQQIADDYTAGSSAQA